jgi:threonine dehydratase
VTQIEPFTMAEIDAARASLAPHLVLTPVAVLRSRRITEALGADAEVTLKLELFQRTGSFKARGALTNVFALPAEALARGITAVSAGNHAIAAAYAAQVAGISAKVVMIQTANPLRVARAKEYGAEVILAGDAHQAFALAAEIVAREGRAMVHPFEGRNTALGTATLGAEFMAQARTLEAVVVPIGGGGLCAGVAAAVKLANPECKVYGVEPEGADSMHRSFAAGSPQSIEKVATIADSLGAPYAMPITFSLCRQYVDGLAAISDDMIRAAMRLLLEDAKLAVEPAGAAATAAALGPLRERLAGKRVGLIVCGANIDADSFARLINTG